jgi:nucleoside-diphosphate-sugar epimerase
MNILITGGCGWTAEAIIHTLHQHGHRITVFDLPDSSSANIHLEDSDD